MRGMRGTILGKRTRAKKREPCSPLKQNPIGGAKSNTNVAEDIRGGAPTTSAKKCGECAPWMQSPIVSMLDNCSVLCKA